MARRRLPRGVPQAPPGWLGPLHHRGKSSFIAADQGYRLAHCGIRLLSFSLWQFQIQLNRDIRTARIVVYRGKYSNVYRDAALYK